ncbi:hypothetical protein [Streptomyces lydicus]|uniref:hypothetical protein n=1 Tax=Streptomyces lydicus TaxID=47763 RepID=UPI00370249EF
MPWPPAPGQVAAEQALDRRIELERGGAVPVAGVGAPHPGRQPVADHRRRGGRREIDQYRCDGQELAERVDAYAGLDPAARVFEQRARRPGEGGGTALGHRPAVAVPGSDDHEADGCGRRLGQRTEEVGRRDRRRAVRSGAHHHCRLACAPGSFRHAASMPRRTETAGEERP